MINSAVRLSLIIANQLACTRLRFHSDSLTVGYNKKLSYRRGNSNIFKNKSSSVELLSQTLDLENFAPTDRLAETQQGRQENQSKKCGRAVQKLINKQRQDNDHHNTVGPSNNKNLANEKQW